MTTLTLVALICWLLIAEGTMRLWFDIVKSDPSTLPGGGKKTIIALSLLWPLVGVAVLLAVALIGVFGPVGVTKKRGDA